MFSPFDANYAKYLSLVDMEFFMNILENFINENRDNLFKIAKANTSYNEKRQVTIQKNDPWFYDDIWDQAYKECDLLDNPTKTT